MVKELRRQDGGAGAAARERWSRSPEGRAGLPRSLLCMPWCLPGSSVQWARVRMDKRRDKGREEAGAAETPWGN